ncbi:MULTISPECIES: putative DNA-binding protein [unclassified Bacillus (in: firmicutes)]|uniref:putative DNA-binding protein n=1 Tax=unclassified Bacillus (in: firmicutes) TaxID=185979 RepID=UPI001A95AFCB|nr:MULTISPECIES: putative DNA-binding protein [unclassified Bacillus (in: firmicutes)]MBO0995469.1 putative DNA-binding protein [Bacillus sp. SD088]
MLEKTTRINYLFDFYQALLTPKQRNYMSLYYLDDFSLGEIAEEFQISRQAVYDNIKRTEAMLEDYEEKLNLFHKYQKRKKVTKQMKLCLDQDKLDKVMLEHFIGLLDELD